MRKEFWGVYGPNGTWLFDTRDELLERIDKADRYAIQDLQAETPRFDELIANFLRCYHHVSSDSDAAQGRVLLTRLKKYAENPGDTKEFPKVEVEFEDPETSLRDGSIAARCSQAFEELRARTLLVNALNADPATDPRFDFALGRRTHDPFSGAAQLIPSSSLVAGPGRDIYRNLCGALYSGRRSPVYQSSSTDLATGNWAPDVWASLTQKRATSLKNVGSREELNLANLAPAREGQTAHNEVLALLFPENLLGLFFSSLDDAAGSAAQRVADKPKASDETRDTRLAKLTYFVGSDPVPIFRFNPRNGSLTLMAPAASALPQKVSLRKLATA